MSTRACIARITGDGFSGVYQHWDGYPASLGRRLWKALHGSTPAPVKFETVEMMLALTIDAHPGGWSSVWTTCYCHNSDGSPTGKTGTEPITERSKESGVEWVYAFSDDAMAILNHGNDFKLVASFPLDGPEPDWHAIQEGAARE